MSCDGIVECEFTPVNIQTERTTNDGGSIVLQTGVPYWEASLRIETPTPQARAVWSGWLAARQADKNTFLLGRTFRRIPRNGTVNDTGLGLAAINVANSTISLSGAGTYTAKIGDMISYKTSGGGYWLGVVTAQAAAAGGAVTIPVWPYPMTAHASPAPRRFSAFGEFFLTGRVGKSETAEPDYLEFTARQLVRPAAGPASTLTAPAQGYDLTPIEAIDLI